MGVLGGLKSGTYCDCVLWGVTVSKTDTTWLVPVCLETTSIVPVYVPAARPATLGETNVEPGVVPARGITWNHDPLLDANHSPAVDPGVIMVRDCAGGFAPPSTATKLNPVGVTASARAALAEEATTQSAIVSAKQSANLRKNNARDLMLNSSRCRTRVSLSGSSIVRNHR